MPWRYRLEGGLVKCYWTISTKQHERLFGGPRNADGSVMAKDPACLFYWGDWQGGTITFSRHLKGCYMDLLTAQFNNGPLSLDEIRTVLGSDFGQHWPTLQKKFEVT